MKPQTRSLLELLSHPVAAQIVDELRTEAMTGYSLERAVGASQKTVTHTLELLHTQGLISAEYLKDGQPGRPSRIWAIDPAADKALSKFERAADNLKESLLENTLLQYAEHAA